METKLARITEIAKLKPNEKFTSLYHHINEELLLQCHMELSGNKATGVDAVTKEGYESRLNENIKDLVIRLKSHSYRPMTQGSSWQIKASMPTPRYALATAEVSGKIYAIGGIGSGVYLNTVEEFTLKKNYTTIPVTEEYTMLIPPHPPAGHTAPWRNITTKTLNLTSAIPVLATAR
ncbi:hypothetical protein SPSYN_02060 [Sporotomaculum syntrophicum]|uniref:Uncharacterized protein n=1 Tax=Sporotomaculum syntrophicum TaxID=182264 RepID=A0A9D2WPS6_9FIRM|nr:kelch repeat-containing protein [Sporotomaculum syntrophicum]KAF1084890.1 hypothetical protein SPSYN_02060 [Sporotomaculum syntrophicum]